MPRVLAPLLILPWVLAGCPAPGCLGGAEGCMVPSPCEPVAFTCEGGFSEVAFVTDPSQVPGGLAALGAPGDVRLANDQVVAIIDALDHPHYLAATGGMLLDLSVQGANDDAMRQVLQATGLLPDDTARYEELELIDEGDIKGVIVRGELDGRPGMRIATRYEIRPCEPGIRVRTELSHGGQDPITITLADGWYLGDRALLPFTPSPGAGFIHPPFGLTTVTDVLVDVPYLVTGANPSPGATYASVACNRPIQDGFHSPIVSVVGTPTRVLAPRDAEAFERFIAVASGPSVAATADVALELRRQLFGETWTTVSGRLVAAEDPRIGFGWPARAQITIIEGEEGGAAELGVPWTHVVPEADGSFAARVPTDRTYRIEVEAFGQVVTTTQITATTEAVQVGDLPIPAAGEIVISGPVGEDLLVFVRPASPVEQDVLTAQFLGNLESCAPLLGHPHGGSPACDRVLVRGQTSVLVPPGTYDLYAARGPFSTLAKVEDLVVVPGGTVSALLEPELIDDLVPEGWLSSDFHVHGGSSFDSGFGDVERVRTFAAAELDVVASTEHDTVSDLASVAAGAGLARPVVILPGTEATGHVLFDLFEASAFPKVIGHWNFFPVAYDPAGPWRGAPWDERVEPGELIERMEGVGWQATTDVAQLNHPWGGFSFGRDFAWPEALAMDLTQPLPTTYDGSGASLFRSTAPGASTPNDAYHVQEVMNGSANKVWLAYRAVWFYLLEQGVVRGGTANSDTHSLTENVVGFPRTLVRAGGSAADFDELGFLAAIRNGEMLGTGGPIIEAEVAWGSDVARPSLTSFQPGSDAELKVVVRTAAWVPVDEVRIVVNGEVVQTFTNVAPAIDESGAEAYTIFDEAIPLADLLPAGGDAWIVVEAGAAIPLHADLDCNGVPDTGDTNGDGVVNARDVDPPPEEPDLPCLEEVGPLLDPPVPARGERGYAYSVVSPGGAPMAFTNPFLIDRAGDGWKRGAE